jgi:purine nucleosidase
MSKVAVLLDTDIGSDIDDAVALAYLLRKPECELLGITTVTGDVQKRAALAEAVCRAAGKPHIPIHCGRRNVLIDGPGQAGVPQYEAIAASQPKLHRGENEAVEFLQKTIRSRPGEITLLTIGPYSNAAILFALDPEIALHLKAIVSMGGVFFKGDALEWNALADPAATAIVYAAPRCEHISVGLDVTLQCRMPADEVRRRFTGEPLRTVATMAETWFKNANELTFHDPLAAAVVFHPELCTYEKGKVEVRYGVGDQASGHTRLVSGAGTDRVAKTVDVEGFFREYFRVLHPEQHA